MSRSVLARGDWNSQAIAIIDAAAARVAMLLPQLFDRSIEALGFGHWCEPGSDSPRAIDQELGEIPLDRLGAQDPRGTLLQPSIQGVRSPSIDIHFGEHRKADVIVRL